MNSSTPPPACLLPVEALSFAETRDWLERALRGRESLPAAVRGELPQTTILRHTPSLTLPAENRLRVACENLVHAFATTAEADTDYVQSLLSLAVGLRAENVVPHLKTLCENTARANGIPLEQWQAAVSALVDLRARLPEDFWLSLTRRLPGAARVLIVSALLKTNPDAATRAIHQLPDDDAAADALFVVLRQQTRDMEKDEMARLARTFAGRRLFCPPTIAKALDDWLETLPAGTLREQQQPILQTKLFHALEAFYRGKIEFPFTPLPMPARLLPA